MIGILDYAAYVPICRLPRAEIARAWGVRRIVAETTPDNDRMLALFRKRGLRIGEPVGGVVDVSKDLG